MQPLLLRRFIRFNLNVMAFVGMRTEPSASEEPPETFSGLNGGGNKSGPNSLREALFKFTSGPRELVNRRSGGWLPSLILPHPLPAAQVFGCYVSRLLLFLA